MSTTAALNWNQEISADFAKDVRLNLAQVLSSEGAPGLTPVQIWGIGLAVAYATRSRRLVELIQDGAQNVLSTEEIEAAKGASTGMAMNNVYYRATHLMADERLTQMPARLRMNVIGKPGIPKIDFELECLAVSAVAGCGQCLHAHKRTLVDSGASYESLHTALRIAAVLQSAAQALFILGKD